MTFEILKSYRGQLVVKTLINLFYILAEKLFAVEIILLSTGKPFSKE